jgi:hypothetical protein
VVAPLLASAGAGILKTAPRVLAVLMESAFKQAGQKAMSVEPLTSTVATLAAAAVVAGVEEAALAVALSLAVLVAVLVAGVVEHLRIAVGKGAVGTEISGSCAIVAHALLHRGAKNIVMLSIKSTRGMPRAAVTRPCALNARHVEKYRDSGLSACQRMMLPANANRASVLSVKSVKRMVRVKPTAQRARPVSSCIT